jgi:hypothetical protein
MTRRVWAIALLLGFSALFLNSAHTYASAQDHKCIPPMPGCPTPKPTADPATDPPTATPQAEVLSLAQPSPTPPLVPDSGSAESATVSQANGTQATVFSASQIPKNNDSFAAAPGFGPIGVPLILVFALTGLTSLTILKRI